LLSWFKVLKRAEAVLKVIAGAEAELKTKDSGESKG
jgi:hypothetical protein